MHVCSKVIYERKIEMCMMVEAIVIRQCRFEFIILKENVFTLLLNKQMILINQNFTNCFLQNVSRNERISFQEIITNLNIFCSK